MQLNPKELLGLNRKREDDFQEIVKASFLKVKEHITSIEKNIKSDKDENTKQKEQFSTFLEQFNGILARLDKIEAKINDISSSTGNGGVYSNIHSFNNHSFTQQKDAEKGNSSEQMKQEIKEEALAQAKEEQVKESTTEEKISPVNALQDSGIEGSADLTTVLKSPSNPCGDLTTEKCNKAAEAQAPEKSVFPLELKPRMVRQEKPLQVISSSRQQLLDTFSSLSKQELRTFLTIYDMEDEKGNVSYIDVAKKLNLSEGCIRSYISGLARKNIPVDKAKFNNKTVFLRIPKELKDLSLKEMLVSMYYETSMPQQRKLMDSF